MTNADVKFKIEQMVGLLDDWLESIDNETDPHVDWLTDPTVNSYPDMEYPYKAGVWRARAELNADKLRRVRGWLLNEFENIGVQSRKNKV